jgi:hypothetical protein
MTLHLPNTTALASPLSFLNQPKGLRKEFKSLNIKTTHIAHCPKLHQTPQMPSPSKKNREKKKKKEKGIVGMCQQGRGGRGKGHNNL